MTSKSGPQPYSQSERRLRAQDIVAQLQEYFRPTVQAIGIYGSLAHGSDGLYSDIEMYCILDGEYIDSSLEWSTGPWKAEIDLYSSNVLLKIATIVEGDWPITHGAVLHVWPIFDPGSFFSQLRQAALAVPDSKFQEAMQTLIVGEIYEMVGKIRNAFQGGNTAPLAYYASKLAVYGACLVGLANRRTYQTSSTMFAESLALPGAPDGYTDLCQLVISGKLDAASKIAKSSDSFWAGIEHWAAGRGLTITNNLYELLEKSRFPKIWR